MTNTVKIAPLDQALTFARLSPAKGGQIIAVTAYDQDVVTGLDLSALKSSPDEDPIDLINRLGYGALQAAIHSGQSPITVAACDLDRPIDLTSEHIAVGTNYPEHAKESTLQIRPFLFPKYVTPTGPRADIPMTDGLLDYEVELCLVVLKPLGLDAPAQGGLILGNDVTDRAALMRHVDLKDPQSGKGFTTGKSGPGFLPVGDLFVVPRDLKAFVTALDLQLSVNGTVRQSGPVTDWIWDLDEILKQSRAKRDARWAWREGTAKLTFSAEGEIPPRTLIMAGTPAGTIFHGVPGGDRLRGAVKWLLSGRKKPLLAHVIEAYITRNLAQRTYLQKGDQVVIIVDRLGVLSNRIV
jgi:2-keto-4-pentenoate hydratase/2-oxohepta-3-ene-1,7-dioic acid hydratase in catechol pathway